MTTHPLRQLKTENALFLHQLKATDQQLIISIIRRLGLLKINTVHAQLIKRDLIGMAMECEKRGLSFEIELGDKPENFAADIYNSSNLSNWKELTYKFILRLSGLFFTWFVASSLLLFGSFTWQGPVVIYPFYVGIGLVSFGIEFLMEPYFAMKKGLLRHLPQLTGLGLILITLAIAATFAPSFNQHTIQALPLTAISGIIFIMTYYGYHKTLKKII